MGHRPRHPLRASCSLPSAFILSLLSCFPASSSAFSFTLDRDECFIHHVPPDQYNMVAFVSQYGSYWSSSDNPNEIDLKVRGGYSAKLRWPCSRGTQSSELNTAAS